MNPESSSIVTKTKTKDIFTVSVVDFTQFQLAFVFFKVFWVLFHLLFSVILFIFVNKNNLADNRCCAIAGQFSRFAGTSLKYNVTQNGDAHPHQIDIHSGWLK